MNLNTAKYCFLNSIYCESGMPVLYEMVLSDTYYMDVCIIRVGKDKLKDIYNNTDSVKDWCFEQGYLKCSTEIDEIPISDVVRDTEGMYLDCDVTTNSFYQFLHMGEQNNYLVVSDTVVKSDGAWSGTEVTPFYQIHFSMTTMSCYARIFSEDGLKNKMLVTMEDGVLKMHPFYFAVPENSLDSIAQSITNWDKSCLDNKVINGESYRIFESGVLPIYENAMVLSKCLINKAMGARMRANDTVRGLKRFINSVFKALNDDKEESERRITWIGGNTDYKSHYGVYFKSSYRPLSNNDLDSVIAMCVRDVINTSSNFQEARVKIENMKLAATTTYFMQVLAAGLLADGVDPDFPIAGVIKMKDINEKNLFYADLFLYKTRIYMYLTKSRFIGKGSFGSRTLFGGCEKDVTMIEEDFYEQPNM
ncbi:hypothetical protein AALB53_08195 [Lachnospiraceae bacterium 47-T17]